MLAKEVSTTSSRLCWMAVAPPRMPSKALPLLPSGCAARAELGQGGPLLYKVPLQESHRERCLSFNTL